MKDWYIKNYKTLMKKIEVTNKWEDTLCSCVRRLNNANISILPKTVYKYNEIPMKISMAFFTEIEKKS